LKKVIGLFLIVVLMLVAVGCGSSSTSNDSNANTNNTNTNSTSNSAENKAASTDYPKKQIKMVIPYGPGGATDIIFRLIAKSAEEYLGQTIVPVNIQGASSTNGSREVKNADPDGYTILASHDVIATAYFAGVVDYSFEAFEPIALLTQTPNIPTVHADSGWKNINDFISHVKANPGEVKWSLTPGSTDHFFIAQLMDTAGLDVDDLKLVGYEGTGEQINGLLAKQIHGAMTNVTSGKAYFEDNTFIPLGVAHDERLPENPDLPTLIEQGIDMTNATSRGLFAPKGTPKEVIVKIEEAFRKATESPEVQAKIAELGSIIRFKSHDEYKAFLDDLQIRLEKLSKNMEF
jgi:tripartite-type tricarboxylate transporter receptor subunit TctC